MIRLGIYTGKVYDRNVDPDLIKECCIICTDIDLEKDISESVLISRNNRRLECDFCRGCEEALSIK